MCRGKIGCPARRNNIIETKEDESGLEQVCWCTTGKRPAGVVRRGGVDGSPERATADNVAHTVACRVPVWALLIGMVRQPSPTGGATRPSPLETGTAKPCFAGAPSDIIAPVLQDVPLMTSAPSYTASKPLQNIQAMSQSTVSLSAEASIRRRPRGRPPPSKNRPPRQAASTPAG